MKNEMGFVVFLIIVIVVLVSYSGGYNDGYRRGYTNGFFLGKRLFMQPPNENGEYVLKEDPTE